MNSEVKKAWVKALRSGEYKQGKMALGIMNAEKEKTYCCLGVLCVVVDKQFPDFRQWLGLTLRWNNGVLSVSDKEELSTSTLPISLADVLNLDPIGSYADGLNALSADNDQSGHSFERIANTIEREF